LVAFQLQLQLQGQQAVCLCAEHVLDEVLEVLGLLKSGLAVQDLVWLRKRHSLVESLADLEDVLALLVNGDYEVVVLRHKFKHGGPVLEAEVCHRVLGTPEVGLDLRVASCEGLQSDEAGCLAALRDVEPLVDGETYV